ncbi:hypothetical protein [Blastococcus sp. CT_GayMR16]|uniref:hypothetical protein n=1 Tax=Blastococcus sp. CT_GayMR16 TaxID=2559607 RepID=UPI0010743983|nr:hypothetical protein [Blastococcus sp. CT_GayMR16]TFV89081.1 hypothetical protein E4P38_07955 [Blastococcus sp. CT_GayMR16]
MIASDWTPVHRADGEHVGYLVPDGAPDLVLPMTLVGSPLGPPTGPDVARADLVERGLRYLDRRWWCRLPAQLPGGVLPAGSPLPGWDWRPVLLVEVSPGGCRVRPEWPPPEELTAPALCRVPSPACERRGAEGPFSTAGERREPVADVGRADRPLR